MRIILIFLATLLFSNEINYIKKAKEYLKIGSQEAIYDAANNFYRAKEYKKAIELYKKITKPSLKFKALYNLGNAYAYSKELLKAKEAYEEALKIKKDKDALYNLRIIEKLLKKQHPKKQSNQNKSKNNKNNSKNQKSNNNHSKK